MKRSINAILDVSMLGIGLYYRQARTGVSRVAEQLMIGLWQTDEVMLSLAASTHLSESMRYARISFGNIRPSFVNRPIERKQAMIENGLLSPFQINSLPTKIIREGFYQTRKSFQIEKARFDTRQWPTGSIYHSPFYSIPETIRQNQNVKTVQTIFDLIPVFHPEWFPSGDNTIQHMIKMLSPDTHIITVSKATKDDFCNYTRTDPSQVTPIHLAASPDLFHPVKDQSIITAVRQQYKLGDSPYLLSLATFEPRKNIDHLVRCFAQVVRSRAIPADVKLVLVGTKGWKFEKIIGELANNSDLHSRIVVTGFVPDILLAPLYSGALGFLYPSLYEGFGLPPLEAMQCGLPVIVSNIPSVKEVVDDAAISVSPTDADALSQAISTLVNSASVRAELVTKALQRAKIFSWETFIGDHVALYNRMLS